MPISHRNISLRELRTFCLAAELRSFRGAADRLFVTASTVSHQIKHLEERLDKRLFRRTSRAIHLTGDGKALYEDLSPLIQDIDDLFERHSAAARNSALRISVQPFFASELFIPRLREFAALHPEVHIKVETSDESSEKHPDGADLSIRIFRTPPPNLIAERLFSLRLVPASSPEFSKSLELLDKQIISDFPLIVHDSRPRAWQRWARSSGIVLPNDPKTVRLDSMIAVARAAERGLGAALVPLQLSESWFDDSSLVPLFDHQLTTSDAYYVVCKESALSDSAVRVFRDWVLRNFANQR